ncbi:tRNA pseudouridine(38-40) synthase TruA [Succinivibrio sp.]|uniref:tRNA pseudouridine(38-40) synthase TruA n=1 Tax=Succinivibrio sp. TaxID=2053619 RepID=UPI0025898324|nr:tRNA pseudouridine(38-40) synthase TruA [Succinivibrio sp.]MDD6205462.1 tRNA pseudouridine(38-40) synthase TruA [Succinivibrio sp.]
MRVALGIEYEGSNYAGFQRQTTLKTVQGELERALSIVANEKIEIQCAGRTDAGVNATGQVIHFDTNAVRSERSWIMGTNVNLPDDIAVTFAKIVDDSFHARFSAKARRYRYIISNTVYRPGILNKGVSVYQGNFDIEKMQEAADYIIGEHDFSSFRAADDESRTSMRCVHFVKITRFGQYIVFDIAANAFLMHMVRNIVGSLLTVGNGQNSVQWFKDMFDAKDRNQAGPTAKPYGLYLVDVTYPNDFNLPKRDCIGPIWML